MEAEHILEYWIGPRGGDLPDLARRKSWFAVDPALDDQIRRRFGAACETAIAGGFEAWEANPRERVALIILLDQFTRNLFRGDSRAFAGDPRAIQLTRGATEAELGGLHPCERYFALMPWMHSEHLSDQIAGEAAFARAAREAPASFCSFFESGLAYATRHRVVIEKFGRFPHRNEVLGRVSTEEERAFLAEHETGF